MNVKHNCALHAMFLPAAVVLVAGCVAYRGVDFGHWGGAAENISLIYAHNVTKIPDTTNKVTFLFLPPLGAMPKEDRPDFQRDLTREAQQYLPVRVTCLGRDTVVEEYVNERNLVPTSGSVDFLEIGRLGKIFGSSYVVCTLARNVRMFPPLDYDLYFAVVESDTGNVMCELDAHFNAGEQKVVMAMNDYMQRRRAREFDRSNLDFMLRSPAEFRAFVSSECMRAIGKVLGFKKV